MGLEPRARSMYGINGRSPRCSRSHGSRILYRGPGRRLHSSGLSYVLAQLDMLVSEIRISGLNVT